MSYLDNDVLDELLQLLGIDDLRLIATGFVDQLEVQLREIGDALARSDLIRGAGVAHTLKGGAGNLGAATLAHVAADLERHARDGDSGPLDSLMARLKETADRTAAELRGRGYLEVRS
jgi:HPt (histidine-containing phosphotransfer) domain-containing protein